MELATDERVLCVCVYVHVRVPSLQELPHAGGGANYQTGPGGYWDVRVQRPGRRLPEGPAAGAGVDVREHQGVCE
jgi:hypothetical protein